MADEAGRLIGTYSGGMKQRILAAQAILGDPRLIILDEPTAGMDPRERVRIREAIKSMSGNRIILISTHVVSDIESAAGEIILLREGSIVDQGTVPDLCRKWNKAENLEQVYLQVFKKKNTKKEAAYDLSYPV